MRDLTIGATSARSAGSLVKVTGDMQINVAPTLDVRNWEFDDVCMQNGFDGLTLNDGVGNLGVCGFFWNGGYSIAKGFAANGTVFDINTPNGGIITIGNVTHFETYGVIDALRPAATMRARGAADLILNSIESVFARRGFVVDPPAGGRSATLFLSKCIWGATTQEAVQIIPDAAADCHTIEMTGGYVDTGGMYIGANAKAVYCANISFLGNTIRDAIRYDGASGATFSNMMFSGGNSNRCFYASSNAENFLLTGAFRNINGNNGVGVRIDAGCDKYKVDMVGGEYCTTPLTAPVDDASKHASIF